MFGDVGPDSFGATNVWTGDITVSNELAGALNYNAKVQLLETLAHEYQHSTDPISRRLVDRAADLVGVTTKHHWQIYLNSQSLSSKAYDAMTVRPCK